MVARHTLFQPTRPLRGATRTRRTMPAIARNFNPRAPCGARQDNVIPVLSVLRISTHAPLAGRDEWDEVAALCRKLISTHAPLAGRDTDAARRCPPKGISTHAPLAGRDYSKALTCFTDLDFNPRAPCGARPVTKIDAVAEITFQPTRPLRGATVCFVCLHIRRLSFQPTRPLRGATVKLVIAGVTYGISTHAPLAGRDRMSPVRPHGRSNFNPRAPCGARPAATATG